MAFRRGARIARIMQAIACCGLVLLGGCTRFLEAEKVAPAEAGADLLPPVAAEPAPSAALPAPGPVVTEAPTRLAEARPQPQIYRGSGIFVSPATAKPANSAPAAPGDVSLNFVKADLREVVKNLLGTILGLNYVIDPGVSGEVTLQTSQPLPRGALLSSLESILGLYGAALIADEHLYRVVPASAAAGSGSVHVDRLQRVARAGFGVEIVPLSYIGAQEMGRILEPLAAKGQILQVDPARNLLILAGARRELETLLETVRIFDINWFRGMSFGVFPLQHVDAETFVQELERLFNDPQTSGIPGAIQLLPITRLNALLAVTRQAAYLDEVQTWVERLDRPGETTERNLYVYFAQNSRAAELEAVLQEFFPPEDEDAGVGLRRASTGERLAALPQPAAVATLPAESEPTDEVVAPPPPPAAAGGPEAEGGIALSGTSPVQIIADEKRNALVILATLRDYRKILALLRQLDVAPLQVLLEVTIAEVSLNDQLRYGLQWFFSAGDSEITFSSVGSGAVVPTFPGFSYFFSSADARVALSALADLTDVEVISSPQMMVLNNETARLQVGDQVPIATQQAVSVGDSEAPIVNTIQFRDTGVILEVTPRVNESGLVIMEIGQEVSDVAQTTSSGIDSPTIQQRRISSTIAVQDAEVVALGGLIRDSRSNTRSGLPGLKDIPVLGALFSTTSDETRRTELLVLVTPRVVRSPTDARAVTEELRQRIREVIPLGQRIN